MKKKKALGTFNIQALMAMVEVGTNVAILKNYSNLFYSTLTIRLSQLVKIFHTTTTTLVCHVA